MTAEPALISAATVLAACNNAAKSPVCEPFGAMHAITWCGDLLYEYFDIRSEFTARHSSDSLQKTPRSQERPAVLFQTLLNGQKTDGMTSDLMINRWADSLKNA